MARMIPLYSASSQAKIERRARELFERAGRPSGRELDHWLQAEADYLPLSRLGKSRPNADVTTTTRPFSA